MSLLGGVARRLSKAARLRFFDEGISLGRASELDVAGGAIVAAVSGDRVTLTVSGAPHDAVTIGADGEHSLATQVLSGVDAAAAQRGHVQLANELGGTATAPTVATTHSGSAHHAQDTDIVVVSFFVETPVATDDQAFHRVPFAATLLQVDYLCVGGTNWVGQVQEADANGGTGVDTQTTDTTATAGTNVQVTSFSNSGLDAGDYLKLKSTSISGTPTSLVVTIQYRKA